MKKTLMKIVLTVLVASVSFSVFSTPSEDIASDITKDPRYTKLEDELFLLQSSYDSLLLEMKRLQASIEVPTAPDLKTTDFTLDPVLSSEEESVTISSPKAAEKPEQQAKAEAKPEKAAPKQVKPKAKEEKQTVKAIDSQVNFMLIIGSYSTYDNAKVALDDFMTKYPILKERVGMYMDNGRYRIGFTGFTSRDDAVSYKDSLIKEYPQFSSAWPCRL